MVQQDILHWLFDPRGRVDRKGLIGLAGVLFAVQIGVYGCVWIGAIDGDSAMMRVFEIAVLWICLVAAAKRLHDIGLGAVCIAAAFGATFAVALIAVVAGPVLIGPSVLETGSDGYWFIVGLTALPALLATLWLHCKRGERAANRFGPVPGPWGFSRAVGVASDHAAVDVA